MRFYEKSVNRDLVENVIMSGKTFYDFCSHSIIDGKKP